MKGLFSAFTPQKNTNKSFAGEQNFEETTRNILQFANALSDNAECKTINPALAMSSKIDSHWFGNRNHVRLGGSQALFAGQRRSWQVFLSQPSQLQCIFIHDFNQFQALN
jgi:hypothetical protein